MQCIVQRLSARVSGVLALVLALASCASSPLDEASLFREGVYVPSTHAVDTAPAVAHASLPAVPQTPSASDSARPAARPSSPPARPRMVSSRPRSGGIEREDKAVLNFTDADIHGVIAGLSRFLGRNFLIDPRVTGTLTLVSDGEIPADTAYEMLAGALRMRGFTIVDVGDVSRVVPVADARLQGGPVNSPTPAGSIATRTFRLDYESAEALIEVLKPMVSPENTITAYPVNNTLVVTDYLDNLERIARVIDSIDTPTSLSTQVVKLHNGIAVDIAGLVAGLLEGEQGKGRDIVVLADPRSNSVLLRAGSPARAGLARDLVVQLDSAQTDPDNLHVVYLRNAQAVHLAGVLRGLLTGESSDTALAGSDAARAALGVGGMLSGAGTGNTANSTGTGASATSTAASVGNGQRTALGGASGQAAGGLGGDKSVAFSAGGATVQADAATNTLIIAAPEPMYRSLRKVIDQLDQRRAQVLVESLIVEVTENDSGQLGIQWLTGNGRTFGGTRFGGSGLNPNGTTGIDVLPEGFSLGVLDGTLDIPGIGEVMNLKVLANALQSRNGANILSTPNLMTLDNESASIMVGQTVPFVTGRYVTNSGDGSSNPFQTIEREDIGLKLNIRPQISEGGTVKLDIYQEVSSIDAQLSGDSGFVTNKRALDTSVLLDDGQIMVLGGLLEDSVSRGRDGVPGLSQIPLLGGLFRSENRNRTKTNLMIFLRPHVVRDRNAGNSLTLDRYELMRQAQGRVQPGRHWVLPDMPAPILPPADVPVAGNTTGLLDLRPQRQESSDAPAGAPVQASGQAPAPTAHSSASGSSMLVHGAADDARRTIQIADVAARDEAVRIAQQVRGRGLAAYIVSAADNSGHAVRVEVLRDPGTVDAAVSLLRRMGYAPQLVATR